MLRIQRGIFSLNHKHYNLAISDDYLIKKSIKQTIWQYVNKQTTTNGVCLTEPHICLEPEKTGAGHPVRFKTESTSIQQIMSSIQKIFIK